MGNYMGSGMGSGMGNAVEAATLRRLENCIGAFHKVLRGVYKTYLARFINLFQSLNLVL